MNDSPESAHEFTRLLLRLENRDISEAELDRLAEELRRDLGRRQAWIEHFQFAQNLRAVGEKRKAERSVRDRLNRHRPPPGRLRLASPAGPAIVPAAERRRGRDLRISRAPVLLKLAALLVIATAGIWLSVRFGLQRETDGTLIGNVHRVTNRTGDWFPGQEIEAGDHFLETGEAEIRMNNGVRLTVVGPTHFSAESPEKIHLITGKIAAAVNPSAKGFLIDANDVEVVDLGTRFAVTADETGDTAVHVFDGRVTAGLRDAGSLPGELKTGDTVRLDSKTRNLNPIRFRPELFASPPPYLGGVDSSSARILFLDEAPDRLTETKGKRLFTAFPERTGVQLDHDLEVDTKWPHASLPKGTKVSTYLVVMSQIGGGKGEITFDSPVLGVVFSREKLIETQRRFGSRKRHSEQFGKYHGLNGPDTVSISKDRHTVSFSMGITKLFADSARIFVACD